jgi:hypothetical protein
LSDRTNLAVTAPADGGYAAIGTTAAVSSGKQTTSAATDLPPIVSNEPTTRRRRSWTTTSLRRRLVAGLRSTFLPVGHPYSVPGCYWRFSVWSWIQDWRRRGDTMRPGLLFNRFWSLGLREADSHIGVLLRIDLWLVHGHDFAIGTIRIATLGTTSNGASDLCSCIGPTRFLYRAIQL